MRRLRAPAVRDVAIAALVAVLAQAETWTTSGYEPRGAYAAAAFAMTVPLAWRRLAPGAALAGALLPLGVMVVAGHPLDSVYVMVVLLLAFHAVGAHADRAGAVRGLAAGLGGLAVVLLLEAALAGPGDDGPAVGDLLFVGAIVTVVWALAVAVRDRGAQAGALAQRAERLEAEREERARRAVAHERARIARELHDVVAHSISVIAVQVGSLRHRLRHERPGDAAELAEVEATAREALAEMRRLLGLLRAEPDTDPLTPQPGMDQLGRLIAQLRRAGVPVDLEITGEPRNLPPGIDLAAYRIVQEALTNTLRHAGPAHARVAVRYGARELEVEVVDDGRAPASAVNGDTAGHGLVGMRERVALYGGTLRAGPAKGAGFAVHARLPLGES